MFLNASVITHPGNIREVNQDNYYFFDSTFSYRDEISEKSKNKVNTNYPILLSVFDGMGGMNSGELASDISAREIKRVFENYGRNSSENPEEFLDKLCKRANSLLCHEMATDIKKRMGSTASMLYFYKSSYCLCNIGDSPVFLLRDGELTRISKEHSERDLYMDLYGKVPESGQKFKLTQHLGIFSDEMIIEPYFRSGTIKESDKFLICSDGLTDMVAINDIKQILLQDKSTEELSEQLMNEAIKNGGKDNITMICVEIKERNICSKISGFLNRWR